MVLFPECATHAPRPVNPPSRTARRQELRVPSCRSPGARVLGGAVLGLRRRRRPLRRTRVADGGRARGSATVGRGGPSLGAVPPHTGPDGRRHRGHYLGHRVGGLRTGRRGRRARGPDATVARSRHRRHGPRRRAGVAHHGGDGHQPRPSVVGGLGVEGGRSRDALGTQHDLGDRRRPAHRRIRPRHPGRSASVGVPLRRPCGHWPSARAASTSACTGPPTSWRAGSSRPHGPHRSELWIWLWAARITTTPPS